MVKFESDQRFFSIGSCLALFKAWQLQHDGSSSSIDFQPRKSFLQLHVSVMRQHYVPELCFLKTEKLQAGCQPFDEVMQRDQHRFDALLDVMGVHGSAGSRRDMAGKLQAEHRTF